MKLYFAPGTCSLAPHITLREAALPFELVRYDMKRAVLEDGRRLEEVNEKGFVPVLELDDGERVTEVAVVLQVIADQRPDAGLAPPAGTLARIRVQEWLSFIGTEVHKAFWPIFHQGDENEMTHGREKLARRYAWIEEKLGDRPALVGERFGVADAYLYTTLLWTRAAGVDLAPFPRLKAYASAIRKRPTVVAALEAEGLMKPATA